MPPSLAASLPADVLARIFAATEVKNRYTGELESVLCFEERTRAEASGGGGWRHEAPMRGINPTLQQRTQSPTLQQRTQTPHDPAPLPQTHRA